MGRGVDALYGGHLRPTSASNPTGYDCTRGDAHARSGRESLPATRSGIADAEHLPHVIWSARTRVLATARRLRHQGAAGRCGAQDRWRRAHHLLQQQSRCAALRLASAGPKPKREGQRRGTHPGNAHVGPHDVRSGAQVGAGVRRGLPHRQSRRCFGQTAHVHRQQDHDARRIAATLAARGQVRVRRQLVVSHQRPHQVRRPVGVRVLRGRRQLPVHHCPILSSDGSVLG